MGLLIDGRWHDQWYDTGDSGRFQRESAQRRNWVTADGSAGPSGSSGFKAEAGRYHLYVSLACGFHAIRPPSPLSSGQAFHGHLATCSTAIRPGSRSAATQGLHC